MSWLRRFALLAAVAAGGVATVSCAVQTDAPDGASDPPVSTESLDAIRKAELSRRARRPAGDPEREHGFNYDRVKKGREDADKRPKPADTMPATACRSVETVPKSADSFTGPHRVHDLTTAWFVMESGFGVGRMGPGKNKCGVSVIMGAEVMDRVELVSLLTAAEPSAYVLDEMATPPLARQAKRRPLDEFEKLGLEAVRKGEELVWTKEAPKRMFGAIRARKDCLDCHSTAKEGELLGAFTYYLDVPVNEVKR